MDFRGKALRNSWIFVNVGFYETSQILIFAYAWVFVGILSNGFKKKKNQDFRETFWKFYIRAILGVIFEILYPGNERDAEIYKYPDAENFDVITSLK